MIFVAFFLPLAGYLLVLGLINRRRHPLIVSGTWDFIGILCAASGFLFVGGPALLTSLHENWRRYWVLGQGGESVLGALLAWPFWAFLFALYFFGVVAGAAYVLRQRRSLTCIYNVEPALLEHILPEACEQVGLSPVCSGNLFLFELNVPSAQRNGPPDGIQAHNVPTSDSLRSDPSPVARPTSAQVTVEIHGKPVAGWAMLEIEPFPLLRHVTLRWAPSHCPLRQEIEKALAERLAHHATSEHEVGSWLIALALVLGIGSAFGTLLLLLRWALRL